jgi:hypothetical protein
MRPIRDSLEHRPDLAFWLGILAIVLFGCVQATSRFHYSLNVDEPFSANLVQLPISEMWQAFRNDNAHPLYYFLLRGWVGLFGEGEIALRIPSILFFAAMLVFIGLAARYLAGPLSGLVAAFLGSISTEIGLAFAAVVRPYALLGLLVTLSTFIAIRVMRIGQTDCSPKPGWGVDTITCVLFVVVCTLGLLTHPIFLFFLTACALSSAFTGKRPFILLTIGGAISVGLYFILWGEFFLLALSLPAVKWIKRPGPFELLAGFFYLWGLLGSLLLFEFLALMTMRQRHVILPLLKSLTGRVIISIVALSSIGPFIVSQLKPIYAAHRTPAIFLPAASILVSIMLAQFKPRRRVVAILGVLALCSTFFSALQFLSPAPFSTRISVANVVSQARCGDRLISAGMPFAEVKYYLRRFNAPPCLRLESFPSEIQDHPGWLDVEGSLSRREELKAEAVATVTQLMNQPQSKVWVFYQSAPLPFTESHTPVAEILKSELEARLLLSQVIKAKGTFFDSILVYSMDSRAPYP